jgi:hypothetical protein
MLLGLVTSLVYKEPEVSLAALENAGLSRARFFDFNTKSHDTQAVVVPVEDAIVVSFRGTEHTTDIRTNMRFNFMPSPLGGRVHEGFFDALNDRTTPNGPTAWQEIMSYVDDLASTGKYKNIYFTGHSLGGAMATMSTTRFVGTDLRDFPDAQKLEMAELVTFGQPKTFDKKGEEKFSEAVEGKAARYVHRSDMVPSVPLFGMNKTSIGFMNIPTHFDFYEQCTGCQYINGAGNVSGTEHGAASWAKISVMRMLKPLVESLSFVENKIGEYLEHHSLGKYYLPAVDKEMRKELTAAGMEPAPIIDALAAQSAGTPHRSASKRLADYVPTLVTVAVQEAFFSKPKGSESWQHFLDKRENGASRGSGMDLE